MKPTYFILYILTLADTLCSQVSRPVSEPLIVKWKQELLGEYTGVSGLTLLNEKIYITATGDQAGSSFNIFSSTGDLLFNSSNYARIRSLFSYDNALFSMGDERLTKRNLLGIIEKETMLPLSEHGDISARNGKILNDRAYTTHLHSYILKFSLNGQQLFKKTMGSCVNHLLDVGGKFIYVFSSYTDPAIGSRLMQYDTLGNQKWSLPMGTVNNIVADNHGNCYVFSLVPQKSNIVSKYNVEGELLWTKEVTNQTVGNGFLFGDSLLVCGIETIEAANGNMQNPALSILDTKDGNLLYQQKFDFYPPEESYEAFTHIVTDGKAIYLGGTTGGQSARNFLVKLSREGNTTGLNDDTNPRSGYTIFPNPGGSKFTIACENSVTKMIKVTVRNIAGQVVYGKDTSCDPEGNFTLDLGKQASGNYTVEIGENGNKTIRKIIIE